MNVCILHALPNKGHDVLKPVLFMIFFHLMPVSYNAFAPALVEYVLNPLSRLDSELTKKTWTVSSYILFPSTWAVPGMWKALKVFSHYSIVRWQISRGQGSR